MASVSSETFTSAFPVWIPFIYASYVFALARTSNTMLNKSCENGHSCLVPNLRGNTLISHHSI